jgi:hypothetical protein
VNDIRKDFAGAEQDTFEVLLDTFADRLQRLHLPTNARGAAPTRRLPTKAATSTRTGTPVVVASTTGSEGWTTEFRIPFKTLRFEPGEAPVGSQLRAPHPAKNEATYWSPVARAFSIVRASSAGTLTGLPDLAQGRNIRVKPHCSAARCVRSAAVRSPSTAVPA